MNFYEANEILEKFDMEITEESTNYRNYSAIEINGVLSSGSNDNEPYVCFVINEENEVVAVCFAETLTSEMNYAYTKECHLSYEGLKNVFSLDPEEDSYTLRHFKSLINTINSFAKEKNPKLVKLTKKELTILSNMCYENSFYDLEEKLEKYLSDEEAV